MGALIWMLFCMWINFNLKSLGFLKGVINYYYNKVELGSFYRRSVIKFVNAFVTYCLLVVYDSLTLTWTCLLYTSPSPRDS